MSVLTTVAPNRRLRPEVQPDTRPPLRLVEPPAVKRGIRIGLVGSILFGLLLLGVFALAAMHTMVVQAQFEIDRIDQRIAERQGTLDDLRLQVATFESPSAVAGAAAELGLVTPTDRVHLEPVMSGPATPATDRS